MKIWSCHSRANIWELVPGTHAEQTAKVMIEFEKIIDKVKPDLVIVVGDVNSTVACTLVSVKKGIPVAHIEAGTEKF